MNKTLEDELEQIDMILATAVADYALENDCSLEEALDVGARWVFENYPIVAAAMMVREKNRSDPRFDTESRT